ncbi:hypothetical protein [Halomonas cerina]|uniref:Uncharacterized protein n=1 Tax=Halomonas cerina TaxID=447424 RepID=A0A839V8F8_9GAMM|nr:hypothetical protein [Halomonas cerina]MBB3190270.1 hypothetical protein [Halomonas cerina]
MTDDSSPDIPVPSLPLALTPFVPTIARLGVQSVSFDAFTPPIPLAIGVGITTQVEAR